MYLYRYHGSPEVTSDSLNDFADASEISEDAANAMAWAAEEELLFVENGNLRPTDPVTRAELASMLVRFYEKFMVN